jgi:hypothetical protein
MLLRCESLEPRMSLVGQKRKGSQRAYSVRIAPKSRHRQCALALPILCQEATYAVQQITFYSIASSARASKVAGISRPCAGFAAARNLITGIAGCCARATSGQAAAALPRIVMKSRRHVAPLPWQLAQQLLRNAYDVVFTVIQAR